MLRFSLIVCVSVIFGVTAKPHKPWNKLPDEAFQDTVTSLDDKGKMSWEVEPPEDMDEMNYDIDPSMRIWKSMTGSGQDKQLLKPEEDLDELYHPSVVDLLNVQIQSVEAVPPADTQPGPWQEEAMKNSQEPEEDMDDIDHPGFSEVASDETEQELDEYLDPLAAGAEIHVAHSGPEEDEDELYHRDDQGSPVQMNLMSREVMSESRVRVHLQPEEDMDELYHKEPRKFIPDQGDAEAAAPVYLPSQRKHSEPEEDLDDLYHH